LIIIAKKMLHKILIKLITVSFALVLIGCGAGGPKLGSFPPLNKSEGDPPFTLTAPTSEGPGAFTYASSDTSVAIITGNTVTIVGAGVTTITATQAAVGSFNSSTTSAILTVKPRVCTQPAIRQNGICIGSAMVGNLVVRGSHSWMPVSFIDTWEDANSYCVTTTINGTTGWRLPTEFELSDLYTSGFMNGQGWTLSRTWSSTPYTSQSAASVQSVASMRKTVDLSVGFVSNELETNSAYVACVR
jgi:hypothetical protein